MKGTCVHIKNTWIKQLRNHKVRDFAMALRARKVSGALEKRAPGLLHFRGRRGHPRDLWKKTSALSGWSQITNLPGTGRRTGKWKHELSLSLTPNWNHCNRGVISYKKRKISSSELKSGKQSMLSTAVVTEYFLQSLQCDWLRDPQHFSFVFHFIDILEGTNKHSFTIKLTKQGRC